MNWWAIRLWNTIVSSITAPLFLFSPTHRCHVSWCNSQGWYFLLTIPNLYTDVISEIFRARLLTTLVEQEVITSEILDLFMSWIYHSGFQVHCEQKMNGTNGDCIEKFARDIWSRVIFSYVGTSQPVSYTHLRAHET